jgi:hypothetical protein
MSEINHFKVFILYNIMWHYVVVIYQLMNDVTVDNWLMMWTLCISKELH